MKQNHKHRVTTNEPIRIHNDEWSISNNATLKDIRQCVLTEIVAGDKAAATEVIVKWIMMHNHIHTIRDDENAEIWIYDGGIYVPEGKTHIRETVRKIMGDTYTTYFCNQVISKIEADTYINQEEFFKQENPEIIAVENGILNVKTRELKKFSPKYKFFNKIPVKYDPKAKCPSIKKFFSDVLANKEDIKIVEEIFGFLLYDDYFIEKAIMFYGSGRNGKGKTISLMKKFIGIDNCTEITLEAMENDLFSISNLFKKKANLCGDLSPTALKNTGNFKKLTGGDMITANRKFKTRVKFVNYAKMIFSANTLPLTYDITPAFFNRWVIVDFPYQFLPEEEIKDMDETYLENVKVRDTHIIKKISSPDEMSGLLNIALDGLTRLFENETFTNTETTEKIKERWMMRSSSIMAFCMRHVKESYGNFVTKKEFMQYYKKYCKKNKLSIDSAKRIKTVLGSHFGVMDDRETIQDKREYVWEDIIIKNKGILDSGQDGQDGQGISTYRKKSNFDIGQKTIDTLTNLTTNIPTPTKTNNKQRIIQKHRIKNKECLLCGAKKAPNIVKIDNETHHYCENCYKMLNGEKI